MSQPKIALYKTRIICLAWILLLFFPFHIFSQAANIKFKHLSIKEGLSQSTINTITQDEMGFMWFGTQDGLNRYDGYNFNIYKHDIEDSTSISDGYINCFYNDNNGLLWIGTNSGVSIFHHNTNSFVPIESNFPSLSKLKDKEVHVITLSPDSTIWIGTNQELYRLNKNGNLEQLTFGELMSPGGRLQINDILAVDDHRMWVATGGQGIYELNNIENKWTNIRSSGSGSFRDINSDNVNTLYKAKNGKVYIGSDFGLNIFNPASGEYVSYIYNVNDPFSISTNFVTRIIEDHLGNIWLGTNGGGLNKFDRIKGSFYSYKKIVNNESSLVHNEVVSIYQDHSGILWIGTKVGLSKFDLLKQNFNHYNFDQGSMSSISRNIIWSILSDEDIIWVGSNEGLNRFDRERNFNETFTPTIIVNGEHRPNAIRSLHKKDATTLYLGTDGGVYEFDIEKKTFRTSFPMGVRISDRTYSFLKDSKNRLWVATLDGLHVFDYKLGVHRKITSENGLPTNLVRTVIESSKGTIWIGTDAGLCELVEDRRGMSFNLYDYEKGNSFTLRNNTILSIVEDAKGFIWAGTFGGGLSRLDPRNGMFLNFTEKDGLPNDVIYGILIDNEDNLWCSTNNGLSRFNAETKSVRNFDENDGLQSNEFNIGAFYKNENEELFFGGIKGINSFYASHIQINKLPPQLVITDFQLFNKSVKVEAGGILEKAVSVSDKIVLSHSQNVFSFSFSALHYSLPERNRYAYKLEGFDPNWTFDDNTRRAKYTNLDPGGYTFKVKGTNSDGIWSDEVSLKIIIKPPFWRIWYIQLLAFLMLAGGVFLFYRNRLKTIQSQKEKLEKEVEQRTIEVRDQKEEIEKQKLLLEEEKEKLETLLLNVLPESTVEELKVKGKATARNYNKVSVMFTDFKGFTGISENLKPTELVSKLDSFFVKFDEIIEKYNVEKIKTIGDAYMCAGGIPIRNKSNPIDVVLASLDIQRVMNDFNLESKRKGEPEWGLRLGVHTGVIIAGVIGIKRFAYDIWGDTVNVASRVETNGEVGRVNISEATHKEVKDYFNCEYRGKIHAKNKGEIDMYFVNGIKPHLSIDGKGIEPNDTFWEYVNLNLFSPIKYHEAEQNILNNLKKSLPKNLHYHNIDHTIEVCEAVERIALKEGIHNEDLYALKMAALYHDAGFIEKYQNNESIGARMAREDLPEYGFSDEQLELIEKLIMVTFATKKPKTILEKILRDADLDYLGRPDFHQVSDNLKNELLDRKMVRSSEHWDELQINFLENHEYYTKAARADRDDLKAKHLEEIKLRNSKKNENKVIN